MADGITRIAKDSEDAIAGRLHYSAPVAFHGRPQNPIVQSERPLHPSWLFLPQARTALDVGEQESKDLAVFARVHRDALRIGGPTADCPISPVIRAPAGHQITRYPNRVTRGQFMIVGSHANGVLRSVTLIVYL